MSNMLQRFFSFLLLIACYSILWQSCATPRSPEGGPKDTTAPQIDSTAYSTPNFQTNFTKQPIEFTFNEWVQLKDVFNQVVISPPLENPPDISIKKKTVQFLFDEEEVLRENATYTINFGESVQDLTEGNPVEDLRFVFATGDKIDSLIIQGKVTDFEGKAVEKVVVMLYENTADTVVRTERPFYFGKTDKSGNYKIENVKAGTFKVFALEDSNLNYLFDIETEKIGFPDSLITLVDSIASISLDLQVFQEQAPLRLTDDELAHYGLARLGFSREPYDVEVRLSDTSITHFIEKTRDSIRVWFDSDEEFNLLFQADTILNDTLRIPIKKKDEFLNKATLAPNIAGRRTIRFNPLDSLRLPFNYPIIGFDTSLIKVYEDTTRTIISPNFELDPVKKRELVLSYNWKGEIPYQMELLPNALSSYWGVKNDSLEINFSPLEKESLGNIALTLDSLNTEYSYIFQLIAPDNRIKNEIIIENTKTWQQTFKSMPAGTYTVKLVEDRNGNKRWDTGNYDLKQQPERIYSQALEELRINFDLEASVIPKW